MVTNNTKIQLQPALQLLQFFFETMSMSTERNIINVLVPATDGCDHVGRVSDVPVRHVLLMCTICDMLDNEANDMVTSYSDLLGL